MIRLSRRRLAMLLGAGGLARLASGSRPVQAAATAPLPTAPQPNRTVPFERGDVVVGCTLLNHPTDDHRGIGRLLHYDGELKLKNTIWLEDTTHIVQGTRFGPDGTLWAFDSFAYKILRFDRGGRRLPNFTAPPKSFAHVNFLPDGRLLMGTTLPFMPGTKRFGDGHLFALSRKGKILKEYPTRTHGGMGGFQGLTASTLLDGGKRLVYTSESGPIIFQYDLENDRQLPNLVTHADNTGHFFFDIAVDKAGRLLVVAGLKLEAYDRAGKLLQTYPLPTFGWASMSEPVTTTHVFASNFFSGEVAKIDLVSGKAIASTQTGINKSLSGAAEFAG
jgi:sugar lactone lactonase YvrE